MHRQEFDLQMARLAKHYGDKFYGPEVIVGFWQELNTLSPGLMTKCVDALVATIPANRPPLLEQVYEALSKIGWRPAHSKNLWRLPSEAVADKSCHYCEGDGWVFMEAQQGKRIAPAWCSACEAGAYAKTAPNSVKYSMDQAKGWGWKYLCRFFSPNIERIMDERGYKGPQI